MDAFTAQLHLMLPFLLPGLLAAFGASAKYINQIVNGRSRFQWGALFGQMFIAFFAGIVLDNMVDLHGQAREGILMLSGIVASKLFDVVEVAFEKIVHRWLSKF